MKCAWFADCEFRLIWHVDCIKCNYYCDGYTGKKRHFFARKSEKALKRGTNNA